MQRESPVRRVARQWRQIFGKTVASTWYCFKCSETLKLVKLASKWNLHRGV